MKRSQLVNSIIQHTQIAAKVWNPKTHLKPLISLMDQLTSTDIIIEEKIRNPFVGDRNSVIRYYPIVESSEFTIAVFQFPKNAKNAAS